MPEFDIREDVGYPSPRPAKRARVKFCVNLEVRSIRAELRLSSAAACEMRLVSSRERHALEFNVPQRQGSALAPLFYLSFHISMQFGVTLPSSKKAYGFIQSCSTQLDIFFHFSNTTGISVDDLQQGGVPVSYVMMPDTRQAARKRDVAGNVQPAPVDQVVFHRFSEVAMMGQVIQFDISQQQQALQGSSGAGLLRFLNAEGKPRHASFDARNQQV